MPTRQHVDRTPRSSRSLLNAALLLGGLSFWQACTFPDYYSVKSELGGGAATMMSGGSGSAGSGGVSSTAGAFPSAGTTGAIGGGGTGATSGDAGSAGEAGETGATGGSGGTAGSGGSGGTAGEGGSGGTAGEGGAGGDGEPGPLAGKYRLVATHSSKCLDAGGALTDAGNVVLDQHECIAARPQAFTLGDVPGGGFYQLRIDGSSDCVDVENQDLANEAPVIRASCDSALSKQWLPVKQDDGSYFLVNRLTSKCLDVPGFTSDDISLQQFECNVGGNQRWVLASLDAEALPLAVDGFFSPYKWANTAAGEGPYATSASRDPSSACGGARAPAASGDCHTILISAFASGADRAGATWLHGGWGIYPGLVLDAGAQHIDFKARGAKGGEKLIVKAGGVGGNNFVDTYAVDPVTVQLTTAWQQFSLNLQGKTYADGVISAFSWRVDFSANSAPTEFYIDDIVWR